MKITSKHTPGPWKVNGDSVRGPKGNTIAECMGYSAQAEDESQKAQGGRESNAALIAAAPDLLATLQRWATYCEANSLPDVQGIACDTFQAIAKAEGRGA